MKLKLSKCAKSVFLRDELLQKQNRILGIDLSGSVGDNSPGYPSEAAFDPNNGRVRTCTADNEHRAVSNKLHGGCLCVPERRILFFSCAHSCFPLVSSDATLKKIALI